MYVSDEVTPAAHDPATDALGRIIQLGARSFTPVSVDAEAVATRTREHVEMDVEQLLERGLTVGQEQVHTIARNPRAAQRRREKLGGAEHRHPELPTDPNRGNKRAFTLGAKALS